MTTNPILEIISKGKIPVIRVSSEGFQNYNQEKYIENKKELFPPNFHLEGCFVHVGGIQAKYVSGSHEGEAINIGYIEPDTPIFCTYSATGMFPKFNFNTAKNKLRDVIEGFAHYKYNDTLSSTMDLEDFDLLSEAIVDASKVTPICKIEEKDFLTLVPFVNDGPHKIINAELLFYYAIEHETVPKEYIYHMQENNFYQDIKSYNTRNIEDNYDYKYFLDFFENDLNFKKIALIEFINAACNKPFSYSSSYIESIKLKIKDWNNFKNNFNNSPRMKFLRLNARISNSNNFLIVYFTSSLFFKKDYFKIKLTEDKVDVSSSKDITEEDYISKMLIFVEIFEKYKEIYPFSALKVIPEVNKFSLLNKTFSYLNKKHYPYKYNYTYNELEFEVSNFLIEYHIDLKDAIFTRKSDNTYYNFENLPNDSSSRVKTAFIDISSFLDF